MNCGVSVAKRLDRLNQYCQVTAVFMNNRESSESRFSLALLIPKDPEPSLSELTLTLIELDCLILSSEKMARSFEFTLPDLPDSVNLAMEGVLGLSGANFIGQSPGPGMLLLLHYLGIPMGTQGGHHNRGNPKGYWEDGGLRKIGNKSLTFWSLTWHNTAEERVALFKAWYEKRKARDADAPIIGGKYPRLCTMVPDMAAAFPGNLKVIAITRPVEDCALSNNASWRLGMRFLAIKKRLAGVLADRDAALKDLGVPTLHLDFLPMLTNREQTVDSIIAFLGITPTTEQRTAAITHITPELNHYTK